MSTTTTPPIPLTPSQTSPLPLPLRNTIYSSLLSSGGIRTIETTLTQLLQTTGFRATLRSYITDLFRTGQATTAPEAYALAMERIKACMAADAEGRDMGEGEGEEPDLRLPREVVVEGSRCVKRELERVVDIEME